jgi:aminopeptidase N
MTAVEGGGIIGGGMEFPMMTLIGDYNERSDSALYFVTAHELGHMWIPMIVNTDEVRYGWMDEGTTTFNENQARKEYFPGVDHDMPDREDYLAAAREGRDGAMMTWTGLHRPGVSGIVSYQKPATVLVALRGLLGEETFVYGFKQFFSNWAFKHPKPWDFFDTFDEVSGRDLSWFWRSWYYEEWTLDQAAVGVVQETTLATIAVEDRGLVPMPARLTITLEDGRVLEREIPAESWLKGERRVELSIPARSPVTRVEIDAAGVFPDIDRSNNVWVRGR